MHSNTSGFDSERSMLESARSGNEEALNNLIQYYEPEVRKIACKYFLPRADYDDLLQEGRIAIYKAILSYDPDSNIPFLHFLRMVIKRKLIDSLRKYNRQKHVNLNEAFSLNTPIIESQTISYLNNIAKDEDPAAMFEAAEEARMLMKNLSKDLSDMERAVFQHYFIAGLKQREVSLRLGITPKSLDNAIQRIRRKTIVYRTFQAVG